MGSNDDVSLVELFRSAPGHSALLTIVPLLLGLVQIANSYFNEVSFLVSVPFALVMVGYAVVLTRSSLARFRRRRLEREFLTVDRW